MKKAVWLTNHIIPLAVVLTFSAALLYPLPSFCSRISQHNALPTAGIMRPSAPPAWGASTAGQITARGQERSLDSSLSPDAVNKYKDLCHSLGINDRDIDWPAIKEGVANLNRYPCTGCSYSFSLHKLLDTVNKIWAKVKNCDCTLLTDIDTKVDHLLESCCDGGGGGIVSSQEIIERLDSIYDVVTDTNTKVDQVLESCCDGSGGDFSCQELIEKVDSVYDVVVETNSIVEEISTQMPCNFCDACIKQADIIAAGGTYTIGTSGVYCLAENLAATTANPVIDIVSGNVTLDLHGHTIDGAPSPSTCIQVSTGTSNVTIKNGNVISGKQGIHIVGNATDWIVKDIHAYNNERGIYIDANTLPAVHGTIMGIVTRNNKLNGVRLESSIPNGIGHIHVRNSIAQNNGTDMLGGSGFYVNADAVTEMVTFDSCVATNNGTGGTGYGFLVVNAGCIFKDCMALRNNNGGFELQGSATGDPSSAVFQGCVALGNQNNGFHADNGGTRVSKSVVIKDCISANSETTTDYEFDINATGIAIADSIALSGVEGLLIESGGFRLRGLSPTLKNCIAVAMEIGSLSGFHIPIDTINTQGSAIFDGCISNAHMSGIVIESNTTLTDLIVRNCTATNFTAYGFLSQVDATTVFKDCIGATARVSTDGINIDSAVGTRNKLIENCAMIGNSSVVNDAGFLTNNSNVTYRGNTAIGWYYGFRYDPGTTPSPAYYNNLARNNSTANFFGVDYSIPTIPGTGGYFITAKDNTYPGTDRRVPWSDLTGYWTNMADPN